MTTNVQKLDSGLKNNRIPFSAFKEYQFRKSAGLKEKNPHHLPSAVLIASSLLQYELQQ